MKTIVNVAVSKRLTALIICSFLSSLAQSTTTRPAAAQTIGQAPKARTSNSTNLNLRHGLWGTTSTIYFEINGLKMLPQTTTSQMCIRSDEPPDSHESPSGNCTPLTKHTSRTTSELTFSCKMPGGGTITSKLVYEYESPEKYVSNGVTTTPSAGGGDAQPMKTVLKEVGTFLKPECGNIN